MLARQLTLNAVVRGNALAHAERLALAEGHIRISYRELDRRTNRLARTMLAHGLGPGDRVGILLPDGVKFVELLIAAGKIGAITVLLNWRLAPAEVAGILEDSAPAAVYYADRFAHLLSGLPGLAAHVVADDPAADARYHRWSDEGSDAPPVVDVTGASALFMMFTSGTTGRSKGCLHSHEGAVIHGMGMAARRGFSSIDSNLSSNPLFHVAGLGQVLAMLVVGGANCFVDREAGPVALLEGAADFGCTTAMIGRLLLDAARQAPPSVVARLCFRTITGGAGMNDPTIYAFIRDDWRARLVAGYGQTESLSFCIMLDYEDMLRHPTATGWPLPHMAATLLDTDGNPIEDEIAEGEIGLRGPAVTIGYWNNPSATRAALGTGWLRTGDLARRDSVGLLHIVGRSKELIKTGGENVYPVEVEGALRNLPAIADLAVAGVVDPKWGEAVKLFVVARPGYVIDIADLIATCRARIAGYKRPRYLEVIDEIPRDHMGKIRRYQLAERPVTPEQAIN